MYIEVINVENKKLIILFALLFSVLFSFAYYAIFSVTLTKSDKEVRIVYMNQVGLYEKQDSVIKVQNELKKQGFTSFTMKQNDLTAVVCSVSTDEQESKSQQEKLKNLKYSYIAKQMRVEDQEVIALIDQKEFGKALERLGK